MIRLSDLECKQVMQKFPTAQIVGTKHHNFVVCSDSSVIASYIKELRNLHIISSGYDETTRREIKQRREAKNAYYRQLASLRRERQRMT